MRNAIVGFITVMILILTGVITLNIQNQTLRANELDTNLGAAMEQSMEIFMLKPRTQEEKSRELLIADVIGNLLLKTTTDSTFKVEVLSVDIEKGLLDVRVQEIFNQFGSGKGKVECRKTVVLETYEEEKEKYFPVSFYVENQIVKQVMVHWGGNLTLVRPVAPVKKGYIFQEWELIGLGMRFDDLSEIIVTEELKFQAIFVAEQGMSDVQM